MRTIKTLAIAGIAALAFSSAASAADLLIGADPAPVVDNYSSGLSWDGAYAGVYLSGQTGAVYGLGADLGVNTTLGGNLLGGIEGNIAYLNDESWQGQVHGKLGFGLDNFAFYGILGVGYNSDTAGYAPVGVGAEFALADNLSLKAEYQYQYDFSDSSQDAHVGKIGLNWHF